MKFGSALAAFLPHKQEVIGSIPIPTRQCSSQETLCDSALFEMNTPERAISRVLVLA